MILLDRLDYIGFCKEEFLLLKAVVLANSDCSMEGNIATEHLRETLLSSMILLFIFSLPSSSVRISWNSLARTAFGVAGKNPTVLAGRYQLVFDINFFLLLSSGW